MDISGLLSSSRVDNIISSFCLHVYEASNSYDNITRFWATLTSNGSPYATRDRCPDCPVCLSVTLVYCGQTAGCIKMSLGTEIGLGEGHIALDRDLAPPLKGAEQPLPMHFSAHVYCAKRYTPSQQLLSSCSNILSVYVKVKLFHWTERAS